MPYVAAIQRDMVGKRRRCQLDSAMPICEDVIVAAQAIAPRKVRRIMSTEPPSSVTQLLDAVGRGDRHAHDRLWALVYDELHAIAQRQMAGEADGRTLQTTALIHEAYIRLVGDGSPKWANRRHFFAAAAKAMRLIRTDGARKSSRLKRGGGRRREPLDDAHAAFVEDPATLLAVDEVLTRLEQRDPRKAEVVMLRYFAGLTIDETADALGLSPKTVDNEWRIARAWLYGELSKGDTNVS